MNQEVRTDPTPPGAPFVTCSRVSWLMDHINACVFNGGRTSFPQMSLVFAFLFQDPPRGPAWHLAIVSP